MIKASIGLQELRRKIYLKAKAEPAWRFWELFVHGCQGFGWKRWSSTWADASVFLSTKASPGDRFNKR